MRILGRRRLLRIFQVPGLILLPLVFCWSRRRAACRSSAWGMFFVGLTTIAQFSFWGNYLPRVYPVTARHRRELRGERRRPHVRHVGRAHHDAARAVHARRDAADPAGLRCALVGTTVYVIGFAASFWLPEPTGRNS